MNGKAVRIRRMRLQPVMLVDQIRIPAGIGRVDTMVDPYDNPRLKSHVASRRYIPLTLNLMWRL